MNAKRMFMLLIIATALSLPIIVTQSAQAGAPFTFTGAGVGASTTDVRSVLVADLDNDSYPDVISGNSTGQVIAWHNDGTPFNGSWTPVNVGLSTDLVFGLAAADIDRDGDLDLVTGSGPAEDYEVIVWENDGTPFDGGWIQHDVGAASETNRVEVADLDNDGWLDIVSLGSEYGPNGHVWIWHNDGTPFDNPWASNTLVTDWALAEVEVADLDNDGYTDIIYSYHEYYVMALKNDGTPFNGGWSSNYVGFGGPGMVSGIVASDFDGDGDMDLATACGYSPARPQYVFNNDGSPFSGSWLTNSIGTVKAVTVDAADFDMDGDEDLVNNENGVVVVWANDSTPFSGGWGRYNVGTTPSTQINRVTTADLDKDGDADIVSVTGATASTNDYEIMAWENLLITNSSPVLGSVADVSVNEGAIATNTGSVSDPDGDDVTLTASAGTVTNNGDGTWSWSMDAVDGPADSQMVTITADDGRGGTAQTSFDLTVDNVAPSAGQIGAPISPVLLGTTMSVSTVFSDVGILDTHTAVYDWGDGSTSAASISETGGSGTASGSHVYTSAGVYTLKLTVTDKDGGSAYSTYEYVVVYDPSAGFVTGGGWINSPAGAYAADPTLTGKASFGFVSRYQKGAPVPTGQTQFQFSVAGLSFHSTSYDWLVIAGSKAQYKGTGTINGTGGYGFMLTATDGQLTGGGGMDKFRIKIWDKATGAVVYDNMMGSTDTDSPTTMLGGGSIVIHK